MSEKEAPKEISTKGMPTSQQCSGKFSNTLRFVLSQLTIPSRSSSISLTKTAALSSPTVRWKPPYSVARLPLAQVRPQVRLEIIDPNITNIPHIWRDEEGSPEGSVSTLDANVLDLVPFTGCSPVCEIHPRELPWGRKSRRHNQVGAPNNCVWGGMHGT